MMQRQLAEHGLGLAATANGHVVPISEDLEASKQADEQGPMRAEGRVVGNRCQRRSASGHGLSPPVPPGMDIAFHCRPLLARLPISSLAGTAHFGALPLLQRLVTSLRRDSQ